MSHIACKKWIEIVNQIFILDCCRCEPVVAFASLVHKEVGEVLSSNNSIPGVSNVFGFDPLEAVLFRVPLCSIKWIFYTC